MDEVAFGLSVDPWVILATTVLTLVTVLLSVWIPAKRASKANIIDSLKSSGGSQASKRGRRLAAAATIPARLWKSRGISGRLFGIGGKLAAINRKRGTTKGKAAAVSLALAIVLLMTAGSLNTFLGSLVGAVSGGNVTAGEVAVIAQLDQASENGPNGLPQTSSLRMPTSGLPKRHAFSQMLMISFLELRMLKGKVGSLPILHHLSFLIALREACIVRKMCTRAESFLMATMRSML